VRFFFFQLSFLKTNFNFRKFIYVAYHPKLSVNGQHLYDRYFITQMPVRFNVETEGPMLLNGVCIEVDTDTGRALSIERISLVDNTISIAEKD